MPPGVCVESDIYGCKICENNESGLYWLYFQKFSPFSPFLAYELLPNTTSTPNKLQNTQAYTTKPTGLFLESEIVVEIYWPKIYF